MLEQIGQALPFEAWFSATKQGKTGLTVTIDVYRNAALIITAGSATEIGDGWYAYVLDASYVTVGGSYRATFKTADATVDWQHLPSYWRVGSTAIERLDAAVSSRSSHTPADVWANGTRTLSSFGTLVADTAAAVWASVSRTLTALNWSIITNPSAVQNLSGTTIKAVTDTVTANGATVTLSQVAPAENERLQEGALNWRRGDRISQQITGLGSLVGRTNLEFMAKRCKSDPDSDAVLHISELVGLKRLNGSTSVTAGDASLTVDDATAGDITIVVAASVMDDLDIENLYYDVQFVNTSTTPDTVTTLADSILSITGDVNRAVT